MAYAEGEAVNEKPALYIYPFYLEPLYILEQNDLQEEYFMVLCDKVKMKYFIFEGGKF